ncbi:HgcAB-associated protein HgcC [Acidobacteriota bacterium]
MAAKESKKTSGKLKRSDLSCCRVEAVTSIDERGQMVLPKEIREKTQIQPGDKLGIIVWEKAGKVCCLTLIKMGELSEMVKDLLSPMMEEITS